MDFTQILILHQHPYGLLIRKSFPNVLSSREQIVRFYCDVIAFDRWTRHLATPDLEPQNNCTESSYFLTCGMSLTEIETGKRDRRCLMNDKIVDTCQLSLERRPSDRTSLMDDVYCKIYSLLVSFLSANLYGDKRVLVKFCGLINSFGEIW